MTTARLVTLALVAISIALCATAASIAVAAVPEFSMLPSGSKAFTTTSGVSVLTAATATIVCESDTSNGEITGMDSVGKVVLTFKGCVVTTTAGSTKINSITGKPGEIVTNPIKGTLGIVKTSEATTGIGILYEPENSQSTRFVTLHATT